MTMNSIPLPARRLPRVTRAFTDLVVTSVSALGGAFRDWLRRRRDTRVLEALDDRMLADIGVWRGGIPAFVRGIERRGMPRRDYR